MVIFFEGIQTTEKSKTFAHFKKILKTKRVKKTKNDYLFQDRNIPVYLHPYMEHNPTHLKNIMNPYIEVVDKKFETYKFFEGKRYIKMPLSSRDNIFDFPFVIKTDDGAGGTGVFLVKNETEHKSVIRQIKGTFFYQEFIELKKVFDVRCLYFHNDTFITYKRNAAEGDFRANISLGGTGSFIKIPFKMKIKIRKMVADIQEQAKKKSYAFGFDFIIKENKWYLIEINTCPGLSIPVKKFKYKKQIVEAINSFRS